MEERLQKFVKLVEAGSFTKAAESMHVSQPALTVAIAKLERELGSQLLVREARPLELTDAGKIAYEAGIAQSVVLDNLHTALSDLLERRPHVSLGMIDSIAAALSVYAKPLAVLGEAADLSLIVNDSHNLRDLVGVRSLDLAIVAADETDKPEAHIADELMVLVTSPAERTFKEAELAKGKLSEFITYPTGSATRQAIDKHMKSLGIELGTTLQSSSPEVIIHMVVSGGGVAVLPYFMVRSNIITRSLAVMRHDGEPFVFTRALSVIALQAQRQARSTAIFLEDVRAVLGQAYSEAEKATGGLKGGR